MKSVGYILLAFLSAWTGLVPVVRGQQTTRTPSSFHVAALHPSASDTGTGTVDTPWQTLSRAMQPGTLAAGDTVFVHDGVYRDSIRPPVGGLVIQAVSPGRAIVTGADRIPADWIEVHDGDWVVPGASPLRAATRRVGGHRDMIYVDGVRYRWVPSAGDLVPGSFTFDATGGRSVLRIRPAAHHTLVPQHHMVERAVRPVLFAPLVSSGDDACRSESAAGSFRVIGLVFENAANDLQQGAVCAGSADSEFSDVTVRGTASVGMYVHGERHTIRSSRFLDNGQAGLNGRCRACLIIADTTSGNNWKGVDPMWEAGGGKWTETYGTRFVRHVSTGNDGPGLWFDETNADNIVDDARISDNLLAGILLELGTTRTTVRNSMIRTTRRLEWSGAGILIQAAADNTIEHNLVEHNDGAGIWIRADPRSPNSGNRIVDNTLRDNVRRPGNDFAELAIVADSTSEFLSLSVSGNTIRNGTAPGYFFRIREPDVRWSGTDESMFETIRRNLRPEPSP